MTTKRLILVIFARFGRQRCVSLCGNLKKSAMKIIRNNIIPLKGWSAVNLFGVLFVRKGAKVTDVMLRHEEIHTLQMKETAYIGFYLWYAIEGLIKCLVNGKKGYYRISFEQEAYMYDHYKTDTYEAIRQPYTWLEFVNKVAYYKGM